MRFAEFYDIDVSDQDDWFDLFLPADTPLCVDPFLIYEDKTPRWAGAHDHILEFFAMIFELIRLSKGNRKSNHWKQAQRLLLFYEPSEFCLGVAEGSPKGAGSGPGLQHDMLEGINTAIGLGISNVPHMEMLALFQGGMGLDRISDATCDILKSYFIKYTQETCRRHHIQMVPFPTRNASWSTDYARWEQRTIKLPANPFTKHPQGILLVPERFLRKIPLVTADGFWRYAWNNHAEELRGDFNYDIARRVPPLLKARLARRNPEVVLKYLSTLEEEHHDPYPVREDPAFLVNWYESGAGVAHHTPLSFVASEPQEFARFVESVVEAFRHNVEEQDGWQLLWYGSRGLPERRVQALFRGCVVHYCRANDIALSGESNAGRGPVDFKFSQGWDAQAIVEIKLMRNSKFWDGILEQTPRYAISEQVRGAVFVAVAYTDDEIEPRRLEKIVRAAQIASSDNPVTITPIVIDARRKQSASRLNASEEARDRLHRCDNAATEDPCSKDDRSLTEKNE